jgi:hypothetical protein
MKKVCKGEIGGNVTWALSVGFREAIEGHLKVL